jgi:hypothetical protein
MNRRETDGARRHPCLENLMKKDHLRELEEDDTIT